MFDDGQKVDLYKLLTVVDGKGGFDSVCDGELWDLVGEECGLGVNVGSSLKLVFSKYKSVFESCVMKVGDAKVFDESGLMGFKAEVNEFLSGQGGNVVAGEKVKGGVDGANEVKSANFESSGEKEVHNGGCPDLGMMDRGMVNETDAGKLSEGNGDGMEVVEDFDGGKMTVGTTEDASDLVKSGESGLLKVGENHDGDIGNNSAPVLDLSGGDGSGSSHKRKREEALFDMMSWVTKTASNPCDPEIVPMPEKLKWRAYSNQEAWKRVLLFREAAFYKKKSSTEQQNWQSQKMHPSMYDDPTPTTYNLRERGKHDKKLFEKQKPSSRSSSSSSVLGEGDLDGTTSRRAVKRLLASRRSSFSRWASARICVGQKHQAQVPEWTGPNPESDTKWFGTQVWPLAVANSQFLVERDPIGKGRQDSCGCAVQGSVECVRFHISEKKAKAKLELGVAFYHWRFDKVGEDDRNSWTDEDEKRFREVLQLYPPKRGSEHFWDHIFETFPNKSRETLVSYYFNVYLLQRKAYHTRHTLGDIDIQSDDDESESDLKKLFGRRG